MANAINSISVTTGFAEVSGRNEADKSGVSWGAVVAGAFVAAALSLILLALGTGIGLSTVSLWSNSEVSTRLSFIAIVWLILAQVIASAMGGYLAGRLRTRWVKVHTDEVYFRDTAHGFLVWAVSLVISAGFLAAASTSMVGAVSQANTVSASGQRLNPNEYFVDALFRSGNPSSEQNASLRSEVGVILAIDLHQRDVPPTDKEYLAQLVSARTGLDQTQAQQRVSDVLAQARQTADTARKTAAHSMYWTFLALLIGAFSASFAATVGGKQRDRVIVV